MARVKAASIQPAEAGGAKDQVRIVADTSPDWHYWRQMPNEVLWKAVALSCNIEPRRDPVACHSYWINRARWGDMDQFERYREFHERLEIAEASIGELNSGALNISDAKVARIKLPEFAAWALSMQWEIPEQLAHLASAVTKTSEPSGKGENLSTAERGTVQKIFAGFLAQGYSHEQIAKPYAIAKEIQGALQSAGLNLSVDTIVNWIKEAATLLTPAQKTQ